MEFLASAGVCFNIIQNTRLSLNLWLAVGLMMSQAGDIRCLQCALVDNMRSGAELNRMSAPYNTTGTMNNTIIAINTLSQRMLIVKRLPKCASSAAVYQNPMAMIYSQLVAFHISSVMIPIKAPPMAGAIHSLQSQYCLLLLYTMHP
jgi:hypothetical protein